MATKALVLSKKRKILLISIAIILAIIMVIGFYFANKYKKIVERELPLKVLSATDSLYHIDIGTVNINLITRSVTLKNSRIWCDTVRLERLRRDSIAPKNYADIVIPKVRVSNLMWDRLLGGEGFSAGKFKIFKPTITIIKNDSAHSIKKQKRAKRNSTDITLDKVMLHKAKVIYKSSLKKTANKLILKNLTVELDDWNSLNYKKRKKFIMSERGLITCDTLKYIKYNGDYTVYITNNSFNSETKRYTGKNLRITLNKPKEEFYRKRGIQKEVYDIHFPTLEMADLQWEKLFNEKELFVSTIYLNNSIINVSFNRLLPENNTSKMGKYPNQLLQKLKLPITVDKIKINNGNVTYSELSDKTNKEASIEFSSVNAQFDNITNIPYAIEQNNTCVARMTGKFNKYSPIHATFHFDLADSNGTFKLDGLLENLQSHQINEQSKTFTLIEVSSLNLKSMSFNLRGNENYAESDFSMIYKNLKVKILKSDETSSSGNNKKGFLSFIANNMILHSSNPEPGSKQRDVHTYIKRDETKSFFNLIWKNIHQGVQETMIRDMDVIEWIRKNDQKNKEKRNKAAKSVFTPKPIEKASEN